MTTPNLTIVPSRKHKAVASQPRPQGYFGKTVEQCIVEFGLTPAMADEELGIATGPHAGILAVVETATNRVVHLYRFDGELPARSREGGTQVNVYGSPVKLGGKWDGTREIMDMTPDRLRLWKENFYEI